MLAALQATAAVSAKAGYSRKPNASCASSSISTRRCNPDRATGTSITRTTSANAASSGSRSGSTFSDDDFKVADQYSDESVPEAEFELELEAKEVVLTDGAESQQSSDIHSGDVRDRVVSTGRKYANDKPDVPGAWPIFVGNSSSDYNQKQENDSRYSRHKRTSL